MTIGQRIAELCRQNSLSQEAQKAAGKKKPGKKLSSQAFSARVCCYTASSACFPAWNAWATTTPT